MPVLHVRLGHSLQDGPGHAVGCTKCLHLPGLWTCSLCDYQMARWLLPLVPLSDGMVWMLNLCFPVCFSLVQFQAAHQALCNFFWPRGGFCLFVSRHEARAA